MTQDPLEHQHIAELAYDLWCKRGRPLGSPEVDWERAEELLAYDSGTYPALRQEQAAALESRVAADSAPKVFVR